jgi:hypothetical protein
LRFGWTTVVKHAILGWTIARLVSSKIAVTANRRAAAYMDQALMPVGEDGDETHDLLTKTAGAREAVAHAKKVAKLTSLPAGGKLGFALPDLGAPVEES